MRPPTVPVPPVGYEEHHWSVPRDGRYSRSVASAGTGIHHSSIPAQIQDLQLSLPGDLAVQVDEATERLSAFDQHALVLLGKDAKTLGPMSSVLLRTEATSSSQIENLTVGARQLALWQVDSSASPSAAAVMGNVRAMESALATDELIDSKKILLLHRRLMEETPGWEAHAGRYRDELVWVGRSSASPANATFVAPQQELVSAAVEDLARFVAREDLPVLVQAAIAHAQFETIHPFVDGNGRTGRALVHTIFRTKGLLKNSTAPISAGLLRDTEGYFETLTAYRDGDAGPIFEAFAGAAWFAAQSGMALMDELATHLDQAKANLAGLRSDANAWKVLPLLISHPALGGFAPAAAVRTLNLLEEREVLVERSGARRNRVWMHEGILGTLDDYAEQLRRG